MSSSEGSKSLSLSILNHPPTEVPGPCLLHDLVRRESAEGLPAIDGLLGNGSRWALSYAELHAAADLLAAQIVSASKGRLPKPDFIVPLLIPQCPQLYVAQLAVLKAGGAFCPLQLDAPPERIGFILSDVQADILIVASGLESRVPKVASALHILTIPDRATADASAPDSLALPVRVLPHDLAYIMYTSGSTGTPKGVAISHAAATQSLLAHDRHIPEFRRFLQFAAPTFDVSVFEIFFPLFRGCTLVTCDRRTMLDDLPAAMNLMTVDACELTPTVAGSLLQIRTSVPSLALLLTIGEMLTDKVVSEFGGNDTASSMLWGMYGPTEAAIHCTLQPAFVAGSSRNIIGVPLDSVSCFVARIPENGEAYHFEPLPLGNTGELVVGGYQLAREYLNRETQTKAAFIDTSYGRLYRTGDRARLRPDGILECLGRISDGQIKLRGQRIELGEIEQAVTRDPACKSAAVLVIQGVLVAFCTCDSAMESRKFSESILETCRAWLPDFMVPGDVVRMDNFPHLSSGKVDKHRLTNDYLASRSPDAANDATSDPLMGQVTEVLSCVLGMSVSPQDTLAACGLDSLNAIRAASRLRSLKVEIAAWDILQARSIKALCAAIAAKESSITSSSADSLTSSDTVFTLATKVGLQIADLHVSNIHPCTTLQSSMLFESLVNPGAYFNTVELLFPADCSAEGARDALLRLASHNDILRSGFVRQETGFVRVVHDDLAPEQITLGMPEQEVRGALESVLLRPFRAQIEESASADGPRAILRLHHALYDGWTIDLMTNDLSLDVSGQSPKSRPRFDAVSSFYQGAATSSLDDSRLYWAEHLVDWSPPPLPRLLEKPASAPSSTVHYLKLTTTFSQATQTAQKLGCHPQAIFQAALIWLWGRILGTNDVVIGSIASGRMIPVDNVDQIMGPCIQPAPLRVDLSTLETGAHLMRNIHITNRKALQHSLLSLSEIRMAAGIKPGQSLYDALLVYQETLYSQQRHTRAVREVSHCDSLETALLVEVEPVDDGFSCQLTYHTDLFSEEAVGLFAEQFDAVAARLSIDPNNLLSKISQHLSLHLRSISNSPPSTLGGKPDLATWFESVAAANADVPALCFARSITGLEVDAEILSFDELNRTANQMAFYLRNQGIEEGSYVAVIMEKSPHMYAAILAVVKAGCAYLPMLPSTPPDRISTILQQASVRLCLADPSYAQISGHASGCSVVDVGALNLSGFPDRNPRRTIDGSRAAYIIYTSGTTGVPKGIVVTQLNITSNLDNLSKLYPIDDSPRFLQLCSQAFDVSVFEIFFTWVIGGCLCSGTNDVLFQDIERSIRALQCTHLSLTPTVAALVHPGNVPTVRFLVTAGEPMTDTVARNWGDKLFQGYGPAETTNICTVKKMRKGVHINHLGLPLSNTSCFVMEPGSGQVVPIGAYGEFCFGGDQVAKGYLGLADATESKFISHPSYGRLYRSGDMGRMLADRSLLISGRLDGQVKLRGQRIETLELETIITSSGKATSAATVVTQGSDDRSDQLVCFYVPANIATAAFSMLPFDNALSASNRYLFDLLRSKVPLYMVPTFLIPVTLIPLTSSGKTDKRRLTAQLDSASQEHIQMAGVTDPATAEIGELSPTEVRIATAASQAFNVPQHRLGRWTPLTVMGLDSISAISFCRCLESVFDVRIAISTVLQEPCIARIAQQVDTSSRKQKAQPTLADLPSFNDSWVKKITAKFDEQGNGVESILPCTPLQQGMLAAINSTSYANRVTFRLKVADSTIKQAWAFLVQRHGILRTCFFTTSDLVHPFAQVILVSYTMLWVESIYASLGEAKTALSKQLLQAVDSYTAPYRLDLFHIGSDRFLTFSCHHALYDGQSMRIMLQDVQDMVNGVNLSDPVPYYSFLCHSLSLPASTEKFWKEIFQGFVPSSGFLDTNDHVQPEMVVVTSPISYSDAQVCVQATRASLLSMCQGAWAITLRILTGETDICFGNVVSGRTIPVPDVENLAAPCFNTIPIRACFHDNEATTDLFQDLRNLSAKVLDYQFTPLRVVQKTLGVARGLFDTILLLQPFEQKLDPTIWDIVEDTGAMDVPLVCELTPDLSRNTIAITLHCRSNRISDLSAVAEVLTHVLQHVCKFPLASTPAKMDLPPELLARVTSMGLDSKHRGNDTSASQAQFDSNTPEQATWSPTEERIRSVLSYLSGISPERIEKRTTIFQLGLDSINAVQVAKILREQNLPVSALDVITFPSCVALAEKLTSQEAIASLPKYDLGSFREQVASNIEIGALVDDVLPCTPVQCGMLSDFVHSGGRDYFNFVSFSLEENTQLESVQLAWKNLIQHHPVLRTGFAAVNHPDSSFAMLRYSSMVKPTVELVPNGEQLFDVSQWRAGCSERAAADLAQPPWSVCLEHSDGAPQMHLAIHHALYDAESLQILLEDLCSLLRGQKPPDAFPIDETVASIIQSSQETTQSKQFWTDKAVVAVVNRFPTLTPLIESHSEMAVCTKISHLDTDELHKGAMQHGASVQAILQAAWSRLLAAYLGEADVVFGVVLSGRTSEVNERAMIPVISTLPVIANTVRSNKELLDYMLDYNTTLATHQHTPLAKIQRWLGHPQGGLFDSLLVYQKPRPQSSQPPPWHIIYDEGKLDYAVSLEVEPMPDQTVQLRLSFQTGVIPRRQASILIDQFDYLVEDLLHASPCSARTSWETRSHIFSITPPLEPVIPSEESLLHQFVESAALKWPMRVAIEFVSGFRGEQPESRKWTFQQLEVMGNRVARAISKHGHQGQIVAVHFEKSPEALFSILGILKAGYCFLALDPSAPTDRKEFILQDSAAVALLTGDSTIDFKAGCPVVHVTQTMLDTIDKTPFHLSRPIDSNDPCYCLYTSGTTGTPKGCEITHDNAVQAMKAFQRLFEGHWDDTSRWLQFASFHFDVTVLEQYWSWSVGMPLVSAPRDIILDDIAAAIRRLQITHIDLTPSLARLLDPADVPSLCKGVFITGGEALKQEILDVWGPQGVIYNAYGPTEATIGVTMYQRVPKNGRASNIGRQFDNVGSYVLQPETNIPVLRGAVGELCVSGRLVGKGYLNRPDLTEERFPTLEAFGERVYRTGDLVRILHDGCFEFLGRADDQVKLRGQRLEIGEINHVIRIGVPELRDVVTLVAKHPTMEKDVLVSFVTSNDAAKSKGDPVIIHGSGPAQHRKAVQRACREKLPGYMMPTFVFEVSFIPLSINNKADFKSLKRVFHNLGPDQLLQLSSNQVDPSSPLTDIQKRILNITRQFWSPDIEGLSMSTSLFDLGLDSISSLQLARTFKEKGISGVTPSLILRHPVLHDLVEALGADQPVLEASKARENQQYIQAFGHRFRSQVLQGMPALSASDIEYIAPCTPLQEGMLSSALVMGQDAYFVRFRLRLSTEISLARLQQSWTTLLNQHAILRTKFFQTSGGFAQVAMYTTANPWVESFCNDDDLESHLDQIFSDWKDANRKALSSPLNLALVTTPSQTFLTVHIFHAIYDGMSLDLMLDWVTREYWQQKHLSAPKFLEAMPYGPVGSFESTRSFWKAHLESCTFEALPTRDALSSDTFHVVSRGFDVDKMTAIQRSYSVTQQTLILSIWAAVFAKHFSKQAAFGVVCSGRSLDLHHAEGIIGPLFNTLPFFADISKHNSWYALTQHSHDFNTTALEFQHVPLRNIQKWCAQGRAIIDSLFVFQNGATSKPDTESAPWIVEDTLAGSDYPLAFEVTAGASGRVEARVVARSDIADNHLCYQLLEDFGDAIQSLTGQLFSSIDRWSATSSEMASVALTPRTRGTSSSTTHAQSTGHSTPDLAAAAFEWTAEVSALRQEVAALARVPEDKVHATTTLLELGLDSIDLVTLSSRLKAIGCHVTLPKLMQARNIGEAGRLIETRSPTSNEVESPEFETIKSRLWQAIKRSGWDMKKIETVLPPTPMQESMMADMLQSGFERYFNHATFEIQPGTDIPKLIEAWSQVVLQSTTLRTVFRQIDDVDITHTYCQVVLKDNMPRVDSRRLLSLNDISSVTSDHKRRAMIANGASGLFQLSVVYVGHTAHLLLSLAHALYDGWSLALLHQDVLSAYHGILQRRPSTEATLRAILQVPGDQSRLFWSQYLDGAPASLVPETSTATLVADNYGEMSSSLSLEEVVAFCKFHAVSLQVLAEACWASVLASLVGGLDVTFGVVLSGRETEEAQALMFPTMNTIAVRCVLHGSRGSFLRYLQESMASVYEHQAFPLRIAQPTGGGSVGKLFNTLFLLQKQPELSVAKYAEVLKPVHSEATTGFAVCVELESAGGQLNWSVASKPGSYHDAEVRNILLSLDQVLGSFVRNPQLNLIDFNNDWISVCGLPSFRLPDEQSPEIADASVMEPCSDMSQPWSAAENSIREALSLVSGVPTESISKSHTPYQLGLDSINIIKVSSVLRERDLHLGVKALLTLPSISELAKAAGGERTRRYQDVATTFSIPSNIDVEGILQRAGLSSTVVEDVLPALPMQAFTVSTWVNSGGSLFFPSFFYKVTKQITLSALEEAWKTLVRTEPILRTCVVPSGKRETPLVQLVLDADYEGPHQQVFTSSDIEGRASLATWPPVRLSAQRADDGLWTLALQLHHCIYDAFSLSALLSKFADILSGIPSGPSVTSTSSWKTFLGYHQSADAFISRKKFWTQYLHDVPVCTSPFTTHNGIPRTSHLNRSAIINMPSVKAFCSHRGLGLSAAFLAAVAKCWGQDKGYSQSPLVLGIYLANRDESIFEDIEKFPTLNILPLKIYVTPESQLVDLASSIQKDLLEITNSANVTASLWEIKEWTGLMVDAFVNFLNLPPNSEHAGIIEKVDDHGNFPRLSPPIPDPSLFDTVRDAYPDAIDVEAVVEGECLAIGVFGSEARVEVSAAQTIVARIADNIREALL